MGTRKDYRLSREYVVGGQARIYRGLHKASGRTVAFKKSKLGTQTKARFRREIEVLRSLSHPNIVPVLDVDEESGDQPLWYTMPWAAYSLHDVGQGLTDSELLEVVEHVVSALEALHSVHGAHRDVTPGNVLRIEEDGRGRWVVSDFGLARKAPGQTTAALTVVGGMYGTDQFAAPECWDDAHDADVRTDIFGLGRVVAWCRGVKLAPNIPRAPDGPWNQFVLETTRLERRDRVQTLDDVLALARRVLEPASQAARVPEAPQRLHDQGSVQLGLVARQLERAERMSRAQARWEANARKVRMFSAGLDSGLAAKMAAVSQYLESPGARRVQEAIRSMDEITRPIEALSASLAFPGIKALTGATSGLSIPLASAQAIREWQDRVGGLERALPPLNLPPPAILAEYSAEAVPSDDETEEPLEPRDEVPESRS